MRSILKTNLFINLVNNIKNKLDNKIKFKKEIYFLKTIYLDMVSNLTELNFSNYYKDFNYYYLEILESLNKLKFDIELLITENNINNMKYYKILVLRNKILKTMKYVTPKEISLILQLYDLNWFNTLTYNEKNELSLYFNYIRPVYLCDCSFNQKEQLTKLELNQNNALIEINNNIIRNIIIHNIIGSSGSPENKDKIEIFTNDDLKVNNNFEESECKYILCNSNLSLQKNKKQLV
jgi:hypothetical protein